MRGIVTYSGGPLKEVNAIFVKNGLPGHSISLRTKAPVQIVEFTMKGDAELKGKEMERAKKHVMDIVKKNFKGKNIKIEQLELSVECL